MLTATLLGLASNVHSFQSIDEVMKINRENRLAVNSDWFTVSEDDVSFYMTYNGMDLENHKRIRNREIAYKALDMIKNAQKQIIASVFLFDNMYSKTKPDFDVVEELTKTLIDKKQSNPDIKITVILDPLHRAYSRRTSPSVERFLKNGIDVFYSDLLPTKAASKIGIQETIGHVGRILDDISLGLFGSIINTTAAAINLPAGKLDGHQIDLEVAFTASLLKANHRKILVTDTNNGNDFETLVSSANPHNGSDDSTNTSLSVKGELAKFVYGILREDAAHSMLRQASIPLTIGMPKYAQLSDASKDEYELPKYSPKNLARYFTEILPPLPYKKEFVSNLEEGVKAKFVSEIEVKKEALRLLNQAKPQDHVRIQMFYLSDPQIIDAIAKVARQDGRENNPVELLLDPSKDAFNSIKDGTPNRQVAHYLVNELKDLHLNLRWYATHGEQNHAKIMSITNENTGKFQIFTGSTNWTGKNMNNINMEANLSIEGSKKLTDKFNNTFDRIFNNLDEKVLYTWDYSAYDLNITRNLNKGQEIVKEWSTEKIAKWIKDHESELISIYKKKYRSQFQELTDKDFTDWAKEKISKDSSETMRSVRYIVGSAANGSYDAKKFKKWKKKYMKKWIKGEKLGLVAW